MVANNIKIIKVRWGRPLYPFIKISTDGSYTNKRARSGRIFRDITGPFLLFYKAPYIVEDVLDTEAAALYWALKFAKENKCKWIFAEVDSSLLVELLTVKISSPWHIIQWIHKIKKLRPEIKIQFSFVYREENRIANFLALEGENSDHAEVSTNLSPLHLLTQGEELPIPYLRLQI
ncbi:uncharacterized protein LOC110030527 [Phalaenopsis equestris]|uniref:uncharacterized protein LOC110030527 n=1 Tax=Phalaenopsis equestris TaxID=78828 RepID=UPI0009E5B81A|nr:uncharacterized protein LOC110030527 [Phalaenopsis equestris]